MIYVHLSAATIISWYRLLTLASSMSLQFVKEGNATP